MDNSRADVQAQRQDHESLIVVGSSPVSSPKSSPFNSRPSSARSRPLSATCGSRSSAPVLTSSAIQAASKRQLQRLEVDKKRRERHLRNIFSDPIIERSLGALAQDTLKDDRAREFRDHIQKVGGRFSRFSFKRSIIHPDIASPILTDFPSPRPSFAPLHSHRSILGIQPESSQKAAEGPEVIEPVSPVRIAARPVDIKNMSLHSGIVAGEAPVGLAANTSALSAPLVRTETNRPSSAASFFSQTDVSSVATVLSLTGDGLPGRVVESCSENQAPRSAYVTAVQNGIFQTSAPFSFQADEQVIFSGAHCPPDIVLGRPYTIAAVAPLSFTLANIRVDDHSVGIFQARIVDARSRAQVIRADKDTLNGICSLDLSNSVICNSHTASLIPSCDVTRSSTPSARSGNRCSHDVPIHAARCSGGKRIASCFVTNINPLQMSNVHDSARSSAVFPSQAESSQWKQGARTSTCIVNQRIISSAKAAVPSRPVRGFSSHSHNEIQSGKGLIGAGAGPVPSSAGVLVQQNADLLHFCVPLGRSPLPCSDAFISSRQVGRNYNADDRSESSPRACREVRQSSQVSENSSSSFVRIQRADDSYDEIRPLHSSPMLKPQRHDFDIPPMDWSLRIVASQAILPEIAARDSPQTSLIKGKAMLQRTESSRATSRLDDTFKPICNAPVVPSLNSSEPQTSDARPIPDDASAIAITVLDNNADMFVSGVPFASAFTSRSTLSSADAADRRNVGLSCSSFNILSGPFSPCSSAPPLGHTPHVPDFNISPSVTRFASLYANIESANVLQTSVQTVAATACASEAKMGPVAASSPDGGSLAITGNRCSVSLDSGPKRKCDRSNSLNSTCVDSIDNVAAERTSMSSLPSPRGSSCTPRLSIVPATTPRAFASVCSLLECKPASDQDLSSFAKQADAQQCVLNPQSPSKVSHNHSKLLLQSDRSLQPTLMSSNHHHRLPSDARGPQDCVSECSRASLPWFVSDNASGSILHEARGACYIKRQSGITVSSAKASLQKVAPKLSPASVDSFNVRIPIPPLSNAYHLQASLDCDVAPESANSFMQKQAEPTLANEPPGLSAAHSGPNHLKLLASRTIPLPEVRPQTAVKNGQKHHRPAALIVPETHALLCRLERDSEKFTNNTLPLHVKVLKRSERRHQRVVLGADAIRAQKLDL